MSEIVRHVLSVLPAFLLACLAVAALPGPSTALFLHRTVRDGRAAGLAAVAGNEIGVFCWALAAGAGLTALLRANWWLYLALHIVGGVVLVYLGVSAWRSARRAGDDQELGASLSLSPARFRGALRSRLPSSLLRRSSVQTGPRPSSEPARLPSGRTPAAAFRASLVTIAANPKAAVFAFSFFPQFLPRHGPVFGTTVALASVQLILDTSYCVGIVLLASRARRWLSRAAIRRRLERALGATLIALGIDLAAATR
jgi:threonine/homoserine/homoserine lactone efflux protein